MNIDKSKDKSTNINSTNTRHTNNNDVKENNCNEVNLIFGDISKDCDENYLEKTDETDKLNKSNKLDKLSEMNSIKKNQLIEFLENTLLKAKNNEIDKDELFLITEFYLKFNFITKNKSKMIDKDDLFKFMALGFHIYDML